MRKLASISSVALSFGRRCLKRITPSLDSTEPAKMTSPSTKSAFAKIEPRIDARATTSSPAREAKTTMKNSGRLPSVDWRSAGHGRPEALAHLLRREGDDPRKARKRERRDPEGQKRGRLPKCAMPAPKVTAATRMATIQVRRIRGR